jgi:phage regulator Rha-like protein
MAIAPFWYSPGSKIGNGLKPTVGSNFHCCSLKLTHLDSGLDAIPLPSHALKTGGNMSSLNVIQHEGVLVVDSRLIAQELDIQHKNFLATLTKYIEEIEEDWGQVAFETETVTNSVGAGNSVKYALLTEPQATLLMTYSRNTEQVRQCKRHLVKAFEKAKLALSSAVELRVAELEQKIAAQGEAITQLQSQIQNLLPPSADFIPPGWNEEVWRKLPRQDKRHFRFLYRRRGFRPSGQGTNEQLALPIVTTEQLKQQQRDEFELLLGESSAQEKEQLEAAKQEALKKLWSQGEQDDTDVPF